MSAESPRACRGAGAGAALTVPAQPPADRSLIDAVSGFINDVTLTAAAADPKDVIQWARFETADINEPTPEGEGDCEISPLLLVLGYGTGVQVWLVPPAGDAQEVLSWRHGTVRVLRVLPTPAPRPHSADCFAAKRPLIALCDSAGPGPAFCSLGFISVRGGEQVKSIKFKSPIVDVVCNKRSVVVSFSERFAVFDACSLEDRLSVTTCYPSPSLAAGGAPHNPLALGARWLAYADRRLNPSKRSAGGCDGEGQSSYTATVLHAAKSLSKGLRGLGETVAHSLAGTRVASQSPSPPHAESPHPGVVTVLDVAGEEAEDEDEGEARDPVVAHFTAHSEAIIALAFDSSGLVLVSADRRGHDFHVFRVNPHPRSPALASVHHLYVLHRGGTTARVQDIAISADCRWVCVSTLRGTTHVFAVCPYGGAAGVRTHTAPRVVNRLSRFHRSAGLPVLPPHAAAPAAPGSPAAAPVCESAWRSGAWYPNPRLPPYPQPTVCAPLAQLRPTASLATHTITRTSSGRQRLSSLSEDTSSAPLLARAAWGAGAGGARAASGAHHALYLMTASGCLMHLVLHPRPAAGVPKEKISDDSPIEVDVEQVAQWPLQRPPTAGDLLAPLPPCNPLLQPPDCARRGEREPCASEEERWLAQVEIVTHAGPHRRLWMGPQFVFKTYNSTGSSSSLSEAETVEVETSVGRGVARSNPVNMPGVRPLVPVLVDSGSASSLEHSPSDSFRRKHLLAETGRAPSACDLQLREDLAEAMQEDHGWWCSAPAQGADGAAGGGGSRGVELAVDPAGCVVRARSSGGAPHDHEHEHYTRANSDETTFRAVVRAPAALPPRDLPARPLPRTTTIPVQPLHSADSGRTDARDRTEHARMSEADDPPNTDSNVEISSQILEAVTRAKPKSDDKKVVRDKRDSKTAKTKGNSECKITEREGVEMKKEMTSSKNEAVEAVSAKRDSSAAKVSSEEMKFEKEATSITTEESKSETETPRKEVFETTKPIEGTKSETKSRTGKESPDIKTLTKETSDTKSPAKKESFESKVSLKEVTSEMKTSVKELSDSKASTKKDVNYLTTTRAPVAESTESTEFPKPKPYSKEGSSDRDSSPRKEPKSFSAWKKDSPKLDWTINTEPLERTISSRKEADVSKTLRLEEVLIKTEEQAWDMLLNEPEKRVLSVSPQSMASDKNDENKTKSKRNRKIKKSQDDTQNKSEDDSFVEIHAIEEKAQLCSGELVSISLPFEEIESAYCSFSSKAKKSRSPKITIEKEQCQPKLDDWSLEDIDCNIQLRSSNKRRSVVSGIELASEYDLKAKLEESKIKNVDSSDTADKQNIVMKDSLKDKKPKPVVPGQDSRKPVEKSLEIDVKDVYVIDTTKDEFPEIQITTSRGSKMRKKSSQLDIDKGNDDIEVIPEKPIKSWSSIAAGKNSKKSEEDKRSASAKIENIVDNTEDDVEAVQLEKNRKANKREEDEEPLSLHEELMRLCKRTDIMVAQCDAPSALNFVEEHHSLLHDLPPLELDFGLDNFRLEVMRDSLLEVDDTKLSSPICKIDIDSIISSIKESTSAFNLIDLEKIPDKKEKGFSVVENDKYTSQEVKADDDSKCEGKEIEVIEKSSEDENASPALSTDSDKEDKRSSGASNVTLPSSKQSSKSKKSRRKKK